MLEHGGKIRRAAQHYGIPLSDWLDLSTGINPNGWPVPELSAAVWSRLPEDEDELETAAGDYYCSKSLLAVAGSQAAIQALPTLRTPCQVNIIHPGYAEHAHAWQNAGHRVILTSAEDIEAVIQYTDVLVLIHPNNPDGQVYLTQQLQHWRSQLAARGGWLVVDEAFMDSTPHHSLAPDCPQAGLIVLRSLGKFFGLAGARVGFVCAEADLLIRLRAQLGPWSISTAARWVATQALQDRVWQERTRRTLQTDSVKLQRMLTKNGLAPDGVCSLFQWMHTPQAEAIHRVLAQKGILTRLYAELSGLRFGLPGTSDEWARLDAALQTSPSIEVV